MKRNVEIKARVADREAVCTMLKRISHGQYEVIHQHDVFFHSKTGRLKLRTLSEQHGELIYYERADSSGPKVSKYSIVHTNTPCALCDVLANAIGVIGEVRKVRLLYMIGQTRVHLDYVEGLGDFIELEVVLRCDQMESEGRQIAEEITRQLAIREEDMIDCAYIDLLRSQV